MGVTQTVCLDPDDGVCFDLRSMQQGQHSIIQTAQRCGCQKSLLLAYFCCFYFFVKSVLNDSVTFIPFRVVFRAFMSQG